MKQIKILMIALLAVGMWSCSDDDDDIIVRGGESLDVPAVLNEPSVTDFVITETTDAVVGNETEEVEFSWSASTGNYNGTVEYLLQVALKGDDFTNAVNLPLSSEGTTELKQTATFGEINEALNQVATALKTSGSSLSVDFTKSNEFEVRVTSKSQSSESQLVGEAITIMVQPYEKIVVIEPKLYLVGSVQQYYGESSWNPEKALKMRYIGDGTTKLFEAYVKATSGDIFKFVSAQAVWDNISGNYGTIDGAQDGNLKNSGDSGNVEITEEGNYYVQVDIDNMTYKLVKMQWGIIGNATAGGWSEETPMAYDFSSNTWSIDAKVTDGEVKFRSSQLGNEVGVGDWGFNIGANKTAWDEGDGNFAVSAGDVTIEMSIGFTGEATVSGI